MKGFALILTLIFLLIATSMAFVLLMLSEHHFASVKSLLANENARLACNAAVFEMLGRHNHNEGEGRFFFDHTKWHGLQSLPFDVNGYSVQASLGLPWDTQNPNSLDLSVKKGNYEAFQHLQVRQQRLEDFAFYSDHPQSFSQAPLFSGPVHVRSVLELTQSIARFRDMVSATVVPLDYASFRTRKPPDVNYPLLSDFLSLSYFTTRAQSEGILISDKNPLFWTGTGYHISIDLLQPVLTAGRWDVRYGGILVGTAQRLILLFDSSVTISQTGAAAISPLSMKLRDPIYIVTTSDISIDSNLAPLETTASVHPLLLATAGTLHISSITPRACRLSAILLALGPVPVSMNVEGGGVPSGIAEKESFLAEMRQSAFLLEEQKMQELTRALEADERIVWFRGSVLLQNAMTTSSEVTQLHFESSRDSYAVLPSLPFVEVVQGTKQWL